jgi:hypothetical protein
MSDEKKRRQETPPDSTPEPPTERPEADSGLPPDYNPDDSRIGRAIIGKARIL